MQFTISLLLLAALTTSCLARVQGHARRQTSSYSTAGFGGSTSGSGSGNTYEGNVGNPWGSNIIEVSASEASSYQYVAQITGQNSEDWTIVFFNKYGPDNQMDGWYGHSALTLTLSPGQTRYVAFDGNSNGGFAAAPGSSIPTDANGGYSSTWGEFDFGSTVNNGWSGFDVSAIMAQNAGLTVQGMQICESVSAVCSSITPNAASVNNAYTSAETAVGGIGGNISENRAITLNVVIDYQG
ncbi:hypothetical protein P175DRAFT_0555007 [Aspergillus ochraceoroseus IBT 24754]|uniref:Allergen n=1 Tax=Aspergillus ochraceoroseus IBT 24754 TaxID=1392256 RepID=A0A2T5M1C6_9EURO|nr:uncharacterized protein P175DRAFT_0555007 [Aspergillus ochraceoroseus IBT 24754]PTU22330.1 hypothetical protein P175DRAFT_0555007 [Aspergillus ochraceoroseus IBT 24754]